jgi:glucosamine--fructose-6-phosphate aminotransferase (isomerizing)
MSGPVHKWGEFREVPGIVLRQAQALAFPMAELVVHLRQLRPRLVVTCARGSSANAASFGKHLIESNLGIPVATLAPSIATVYRKQLSLSGQLFLAISQSGQSDDLIESALMARAAGALTVAIVNDIDSPLAAAADVLLPMGAGPESEVAATKTFVATLAVLLRLVASWADDHALTAAIERLPGRLTAASALDWRAALPVLARAPSSAILGRGPTLAIAREAALKLKEGCDLHAEAFSGAEFLHGPVAMASPRYPVLLLMPTDAAAAGLRELAANLEHKGAIVLRTGEDGELGLPVLPPDHPATDAVCLVQSFYGFLANLAERRGTDIRAPRHLRKVTRTR